MTFISNIFFRRPAQGEQSLSLGEGVNRAAAPTPSNFNTPQAFYSGPFFRSLFLGSLGGAAAVGMQRTVYGVGDAIFGREQVRIAENVERVVTERSRAMYLRRFYIVAAGPLIEEAIFRGFLRNLQIRGHQSLLGEGENSPVPLVARTVTNAGLFTLVHWHPNPTFCGPRHLATVFAVGCVYSSVAEATNSFLPATLSHGLYNLHVLHNRVLIR